MLFVNLMLMKFYHDRTKLCHDTILLMRKKISNSDHSEHDSMGFNLNVSGDKKTDMCGEECLFWCSYKCIKMIIPVFNLSIDQ